MERSLIREYEKLHATRNYGATGHKALPYLLPHILAMRPKSLIDYGCGQSSLAEQIAAKAAVPSISKYDPAIPILAERPGQIFDLLVNVDVLEHVPEDELDAVIADMAALARAAIIVIDTWPARLLLADGRNAHVSLHDGPWWQARLSKHFKGIRPIPIRRHGRVAFKTFDAELPRLQAVIIAAREIIGRHTRRLVSLVMRKKTR